MGKPLKALTIKGFRSIQEMNELSLGRLNVLIGANGAGKSNFVDFFRMLRAMADEGLQNFVKSSGGADGFCFNGQKETPEISARLFFDPNEYAFKIKPQVSGEMSLFYEEASFRDNIRGYAAPQSESRLKNWIGERSIWYNESLSIEGYVADAVTSWVVYHFHDTSKTASMRRDHPISNYRELQSDAGNIAPFLLRMREENPLHYQRICGTIRQVAPFFDNFLLDKEEKGPNTVTRLEWRQKGCSFPFQAWQISDGTIRFICLVTALLQPESTLPSTIVIDEPELGLHPFALELLGQLINEASCRTQVIVSTQSSLLLNNFEPKDIIVVDRANGASRFQRLKSEDLSMWLDDYSLGELVQKNVIEASPHYE